MDKKQATEAIAVHVNEAYAAIAKAEEIALASGVSFRFETTYGAGASFCPDRVGEEDDYGNESDGWLASSQSC